MYVPAPPPGPYRQVNTALRKHGKFYGSGESAAEPRANRTGNVHLCISLIPLAPGPGLPQQHRRLFCTGSGPHVEWPSGTGMSGPREGGRVKTRPEVCVPRCLVWKGISIALPTAPTGWVMLGVPMGLTSGMWGVNYPNGMGRDGQRDRLTSCPSRNHSALPEHILGPLSFCRLRMHGRYLSPLLSSPFPGLVCPCQAPAKAGGSFVPPRGHGADQPCWVGNRSCWVWGATRENRQFRFLLDTSPSIVPLGTADKEPRQQRCLVRRRAACASRPGACPSSLCPSMAL